MSTQNFHNIAQLRFWSEAEIEHRERSTIVSAVRSNLIRANRAWSFQRMEGRC